MRFARSVDTYFTTAGDFVRDSERGDLLDTQNESMRDLIQRIYTRVFSESMSWRLQRDIGAGLARFAGMPNTARTGQEIRQAIMASLIQPGFLKPQETRVEVFPVTETTVGTLIEVTPEGSLTRARLNFTLDLRDGTIVPRNI